MLDTGHAAPTDLAMTAMADVDVDVDELREQTLCSTGAARPLSQPAVRSNAQSQTQTTSSSTCLSLVFLNTWNDETEGDSTDMMDVLFDPLRGSYYASPLCRPNRKLRGHRNLSNQQPVLDDTLVSPRACMYLLPLVPMPRSGLNAEAVRIVHQLMNDAFALQVITSTAFDLEDASVTEKLDEFKRGMEVGCQLLCSDQRRSWHWQWRILQVRYLCCPICNAHKLQELQRKKEVQSHTNRTMGHWPKLLPLYQLHLRALPDLNAQGSACAFDPLGVRQVPAHAAEISNHTQPNLLSSVEDRYERTSSALQMLQREHNTVAGGGVTQQWVYGPCLRGALKLETDITITGYSGRWFISVWQVCARRADLRGPQHRIEHYVPKVLLDTYSLRSSDPPEPRSTTSARLLGKAQPISKVEANALRNPVPSRNSITPTLRPDVRLSLVRTPYLRSVTPLWDSVRRSSLNNLQLSRRWRVQWYAGNDISGYSKVDDYSARPTAMVHLSLYDYMKMTEVVKITLSMRKKIKEGKIEKCFWLSQQRRKQASVNLSDEDQCEEDQRDIISEDDREDFEYNRDEVLEERKCYEFLSEYSKYRTHGVVYLSLSRYQVVNFARSALPWREGTDCDTYCKAMLTFFHLWQSELELKAAVMSNMKVLYKCLDFYDDYANKRHEEGESEPEIQFLSEEDLDRIELQSHEMKMMANLTDEKYSEFINSFGDAIGPETAHLHMQMDAMHELYDWLLPSVICSTADHREELDLGDQIDMKSPSKWKEILKTVQYDRVNEKMENVVSDETTVRGMRYNNKLTEDIVTEFTLNAEQQFIYHLKQDKNGQPTRYHAQLVAQGFRQIPGIDFNIDDTFALVTRLESVRAICALTTIGDNELNQVDIKSAYLYERMEDDKEVYLAPPQVLQIVGLEHGQVFKLQACFAIEQLGFIQSSYDHAVFYRPLLLEEGNGTVIIFCHVNDMGISAPCDFMTCIIKKLGSIFELQEGSPIYYLLGMHIIRNRAERTIQFSQATYISQILSRYKLDQIRPVSMPLDPHVILIKEQCAITEKQKDEMKDKPYREALGALIYTSTSTRPDITFAVSFLAKFSQNPGPTHWTAVKCIFAYLNGTKHYSLQLGENRAGTLIGYCDSDGMSMDDRHPIAAYVFTISGAISWSLKCQDVVCLSTTEAEYVALSHAAKEAIWLSNLINEILPSHFMLLINIHCDNQGAIALSKDDQYHARTKHIDIRFHFVREKIEDNKLEITYLSTDQMVADLLTKALLGPQLVKLGKGLSLTADIN
ncbi:hypothetical protein NM688_g410 [Phlebia brevispora]|uniref:Uncharacterized protein n=1 Tax=Phlebia brevispora TaxID=194682 RepID=A0ACC1TEM3_9APHY|nr:hypothetical protein NM688_g410 [Phlebia brevispora]